MAHPDDELAAQLRRIRESNATLKAFTCVLDEGRAPSVAAGPLAGRLVGVKDIFDTAGFPTEYGSAIHAGHRPRSDAAMVSLLRAAGGVIAGKTVTTEFAYLQPSVTLNPAAPGCTPGGSSSGSAAAVAAGLVPFAIGSQTGGSIVRPASYCGVAGFKPSFGMLPTAGMKCFSWSLDTVGLFAPNVREMDAFAAAVTAGRAKAAGTRVPATWTFGIPRAYPWGELSPSGRMALEAGAAALREAGARVVACDLPPWAADAFVAHDAIQGWEAARSLAGEYEFHADQLSPLLRDYLAGARAVTDAQYEAAQRSAAASRDACRGWLPGIDVLLTPAAPDEAPQGYGSTGASTLNRAWTLLGTPALNVPGTRGVHGSPMGLQVLAPAGEDSACLAAGLFLEEALRR